MEKRRIIVSLVLIGLISLLAIIIHSPKEKEPEVVEKATPEEIIKEEEKIEDETPKEPEPIEEPELVLTEQELARIELVEKYGEEVVDAWERLSRDEFFDYIGYKMVVQQHYGPGGQMYYHCYKILEDGTIQDAYVGGDYYVYEVFVSNEAMFDLVDYHNEFFAVK